MAKVKQLTVTLENRPGALAAVARILADAKVNILALLGSTAGPQGSAQFVVDNPAKAKKALGKAGAAYTEGTLEQFELSNKPGVLAEISEKLAKKGMNIDCIYATVPKGAKKGVILMALSQPSRM
jgi:hypothetical protein